MGNEAKLFATVVRGGRSARLTPPGSRGAGNPPSTVELLLDSMT
jgi:hypothetical protein